MSFQSKDLNLAKQLILKQVNVSSSGERVFEENPELTLKKKEILNNLSLSEEQKNSKIGELLLTPEDNTEGSIMADALWKNSSVPNTFKDANAQLFSMIEQLLPTDYSPKLKNDAKTLFDILNINKEDISSEQKKSKVYQLLNLTDPLTVQTTVHEGVTSPPPDPAAHHDHLLDNSSSLTRGFREGTSVTTSGGHHNIGLLNRLLAPLMRFYNKIPAANRLVTGKASQRDPAEPGLSGEQLMKAAFVLNNQHSVIQASGHWREISSIPVETAAFSFFNQSLSNPVPQVEANFWQC